jgi:hypothetical protein
VPKFTLETGTVNSIRFHNMLADMSANNSNTLKTRENSRKGIIFAMELHGMIAEPETGNTLRIIGLFGGTYGLRFAKTTLSSQINSTRRRVVPLWNSPTQDLKNPIKLSTESEWQLFYILFL